MEKYSDKVNKVVYGGDYNPEQWPEEIWAEDMRLFKQAGIDIVTLNVFSWAAIQPSEEMYDFGKLDRIMDMVRDNGLKVCLATSTGAHPAWMGPPPPGYPAGGFRGEEAQIRRPAQFLPQQPYVSDIRAEAGRNAGGTLQRL